MASLRFLLYALIFELGAFLVLLHPPGSWPLLPVSFLLHLTGSLCFGILLPAILPAGSIGGKRQGMLFFAFIFFIPLFGILGMIAILLHFRFGGRKMFRPEFHSIPRLPFTAVEGARPVRMGEGGAWSRLKTESASRHVKLEAIMAAGAVPGHNASRLLQMATGDNDDEIRLLAFNFYDRREKAISASISQMMQELTDSRDGKERGDICARLAFAYWEFVYNELVRDELKGFYLDQALTYARSAEELSGESHAISILIGRILLFMGDTEGAEQAIERSLELGASPDKGVPFQAEILFRRRDFAALKQLLSLHPSLRHKPGIGDLVTFWAGV
jgi:hypothetical protein